MNIFILSIVSLLLAIGVWIYLHIISIDKENKTFNGFIVAVKAGRAVNIYSMIVFVRCKIKLQKVVNTLDM